MNFRFLLPRRVLAFLAPFVMVLALFALSGDVSVQAAVDRLTDDASPSTSSTQGSEPVANEVLFTGEVPDDYVVVWAYFSDRKMVHELAAWNEPWDVNYDEGYLVIGVSPEEYTRLLEAGFRLEIDAAMTHEMYSPRIPLPQQGGGIPGYACYRTVEETFATAEDIVANNPALATWNDIGDSWEKTQDPEMGYDLMVLKLTNSDITGDKPKLFATTAIHAREYTTAELSTRFAEYLINNYGIDADATWLLDHHEIHLLLQANPDGRKQAETGLSWRKNTNTNYCSPTSNSRGADLNRNFEFQWGCCDGSDSFECSLTYRGPEPASEPEVQAIQDYAMSIFPDQREDDLEAPAPDDATGVYLDIHSFSELVLWAWGFTSDVAPNGVQMQTLGRKLAYYNGYEPQQAIELYPTDGTTDDFMYGELGVAAFTYELGTSFFQDCNTFENTIYPDNLPSLVYAAKSARTPYMTPAGPDSLDVAVAEDGGTVTLTATANDTRFNNQNGTEPTQNIASAEYYIDVPPWGTDPVANAMSAVDGSFDSSTEDLTAMIDTSGLAAGRHMIFVRSEDADGNWGAISAAFLDVEPPTAITYTDMMAASTETSIPVTLALVLFGGFVFVAYRRRQA